MKDVKRRPRTEKQMWMGVRSVQLGSLGTNFVFLNVCFGDFFLSWNCLRETSLSREVKRHCDHLAMLELSYHSYRPLWKQKCQPFYYWPFLPPASEKERVSPSWHSGLITWQPKSEPCIISKWDPSSCPGLCLPLFSQGCQSPVGRFLRHPTPKLTHSLPPGLILFHSWSFLKFADRCCSFSIAKHFPCPFLALTTIQSL